MVSPSRISSLPSYSILNSSSRTAMSSHPVSLNSDIRYSGDAVSIDLTDKIKTGGTVTRAMIEDVITNSHLSRDIENTRLLLKTQSAQDSSFDESATQFVIDKGMKMIATDFELTEEVRMVFSDVRIAIVMNICPKSGSSKGQVVTFFNQLKPDEHFQAISEMLYIPSDDLRSSSRGW